MEDKPRPVHGGAPPLRSIHLATDDLGTTRRSCMPRPAAPTRGKEILSFDPGQDLQITYGEAWDL